MAKVEFIFENSKYYEVESKTGLDFFHNLLDSIENYIEIKNWLFFSTFILKFSKLYLPLQRINLQTNNQ